MQRAVRLHTSDVLQTVLNVSGSHVGFVHDKNGCTALLTVRAAILAATPMTEKEFVEASECTIATADVQARKETTYVRATYGAGFELTAKNADRATQHAKQRAYRRGCALLLMLEEADGDAAAVARDLNKGMVRSRNDAFLTMKKHDGALLLAYIGFAEAVGLTLGDLLAGKWPSTLSVEEEATLRQRWMTYKKATSDETTKGQLLTKVHNSIMVNLGVPSENDLKKGFPPISAQQARGYEAWYEATHPKSASYEKGAIANEVQGVSAKQRSLWNSVEPVLRSSSKGQSASLRSMWGDEPGSCAIECLANAPSWTCPHGKTADTALFNVELVQSEDGVGVYDVCVSCEHISCPHCTHKADKLHVVGSFQYVAPALIEVGGKDDGTAKRKAFHVPAGNRLAKRSKASDGMAGYRPPIPKGWTWADGELLPPSPPKRDAPVGMEGVEAI